MDSVLPRKDEDRTMALVVINDLLVYGSVIARPTGIQRVATGIAEAMCLTLGAETVVLRDGRAFSVALPAAGANGLYAKVIESILSVLSRAPRRFQERVRTVARSVMARFSRGRGGTPRTIDASDWLVMLGAPWIAPGVARDMVRIKEARGARIALLVHDLLPTSSPQWFGDAQGRAAKSDMDLLIGHADVIFAVSAEVAEEVQRRYGQPAVPLPPADPQLVNAAAALSDGARNGDFAGSDPIILSVGTLHPRKNLEALVRIWDEWEAAVESGGSQAAPLVIVGRRHPQDGGFFESLRMHPRAASKISVRHEVDDDELARLYRRARFLVLPSLAEGWGMPVREALVAGRPSIATDAVPAALDSPYCKVLPAGDTRALSAAIRSWWDGAEPERLAAKIKEEFRPRSWEEVATELIQHLPR